MRLTILDCVLGTYRPRIWNRCFGSLATITGKVQIAEDFMREAAKQHQRQAGVAQRRTIAKPIRSGLGELYSIALSDCEGARQAATARKLESLARRWDRQSKEILDYWRQTMNQAANLFQKALRRIHEQSLSLWSRREPDISEIGVIQPSGHLPDSPSREQDKSYKTD